jgi:hypothetical protein
MMSMRELLLGERSGVRAYREGYAAFVDGSSWSPAKRGARTGASGDWLIT